MDKSNAVETKDEPVKTAFLPMEDKKPNPMKGKTYKKKGKKGRVKKKTFDDVNNYINLMLTNKLTEKMYRGFTVVIYKTLADAATQLKHLYKLECAIKKFVDKNERGYILGYISKQVERT